MLVNSINGDYTIDSAGIYPFDFQNAYGLILAPAILPPYVPPIPCPDITPSSASPNPHLHALLIAGGVNTSGHQQTNFDGDLSLIYNTLIERGYLPSNITVLDFDGVCTDIEWNGALDGNSCVIDGPAYEDNINDVFSSFYPLGSRHLNSDDQLFVYVTDHGFNDGGTSSMVLPGKNSSQLTTYYYKSDEMITHVQPIQCAQMIFLFQCCHAGTFQNLLNDGSAATQNRIVLTVAQLNEAAGTERHITGVTGTTCEEFTFYWSAAIRGYYPGSGGSIVGSVPWKWGCPVGSFPFNQFNFENTVHQADYNPENGDPSAYDNPPPWGPVTEGNSDGYTQFIEAFNYANCMDSYSYYGYYDNSGISNNESPLYGINNGFSNDDLFCLNGIAGNTSTGLSSPQTVAGRSYLLGGNLNIFSDMTIYQNAEFTMGVDNAIIDAKPNVNFQIGPQVTFTGMTTSNIELLIENTNNLLDLENATFKKMSLQTFGSILTINNSAFTSCPFINSNSYGGQVSIGSKSIFNNSPISLYNQDLSSSNVVSIENSTFNATTPIDQILIEDYNNYTVTGNSIIGGHSGLNLYYCGNGTVSNMIQNNNIYSCTKTGINVFDSRAIVSNNQIYNNYFGIELLNNTSNTSLLGDPSVPAQAIYNCTGNELYATTSCFPIYMTYNNIYNTDPNTTYVYYDNKCSGAPPTLNVKYNCWGDNVPDPSTVLYATCGSYQWSPTVCPQKNGGGSMSYSPDEVMYNTAMSDDSIGDYSDAKSVFQLLVETYPKSTFALAAMKQLFEIEPYAGNNFSNLKVFYLTNDSILADTTLTQLGDFLANKCDVQMQNYGSAISWYENRIQNSTDPNDSVFAIIDLGHLYTIMDTTGNRPTFIGSMPQYKPKSKAKYVIYRDSLIDLLPFPKDPLKKSITKLQSGQLLQNVPNPSNSSTDIYFKLFGATDASIRIYNSWGQLKQILPITDLKDGTQKITFDTSILPAGIYEYTLTINDKRTDTKKMVVIR